MSEKLSKRMRDYHRIGAIAPIEAWAREVAAIEIKLEDAFKDADRLATLLAQANNTIAACDKKIARLEG